MAWVPIISIIFLLIILLYFSNNSVSEGFVGETTYDKAVDRANPLAAKDSILTDKIPIGISQANGATQKSMFQTALNIPTAIVTNGLSFLQGTPNNQISPRIDNENSLAGLSKFCKDNGTGDRPFDNAKFNENCGMCISAGTLYDGTQFSTPTGVLVYKADKEQFMQEKSSNNYPFPRAIPSVSAATCIGASKGSDADPVLAINQNDYDVYVKRYKCIHGNGTDCGTCQTNTNKKAWIDKAGGFKVSKLILWGSGKASVSVGGVAKGSQSDLSLTNEAEYVLGPVKEGDLIELNISTEISTHTKPSLYGVLRSETPSGRPYTLAIDKFLNVSTQNNSVFGNTKSVTVSNTNISVVEIKPRGTSLTLAVTGSFPLTFVDSDQFAAFDCPNGPYVMGGFSILDSTDPCANPKGQGVDNYSTACLQKTLTDGGCSTNGSWFTNTDSLRDDYSGKSVAEMRTLFQGGDAHDVDYMMKCKGQDISTPCDPYLTSGIPNQACLSYLYSGGDSKWSARGFDPIYIGTAGKTDVTCRSIGTLNPSASNELLTKATSGYDTFTGINAAKKFLNHVYAIATDTSKLNNIPESNGGRYDSWVKCIGDSSISLATVPAAPAVTATSGDASATITWTTPSTGGSPITDYIVGSSGGTVNKNSANSATISGLTNGMNYTITVSARNIMGDSSAGQATVMPIGNPSKPLGVNATSSTSGSATISWNAPQSNGGATINLYTVTSSPACSACTGLTTTGATTTTVTGLTNGTSYTFTVIARNSASKVSPPSDPSSAVTTYFSSGTVSGSPRCDGYNKVQDYHNGSGGTYSQTITANDTTCGYFAQCNTLGGTAPVGECSNTGMRQRYKYGTGSTSGSCISVADGAPYCDSSCSAARANGGCAACNRVGQYEYGDCDGITGRRQKYIIENDNGSCKQVAVGTPECNPANTQQCARSLLAGGCAACSKLGTNGIDCDSTGKGQKYSWVNGNDADKCAKSTVGWPAAECDFSCPAASVDGGCANACLLRATGQACNQNTPCTRGRCDFASTSGNNYSGICVACHANCTGPCNYINGVWGNLYVPGASAAAVTATPTPTPTPTPTFQPCPTAGSTRYECLDRGFVQYYKMNTGTTSGSCVEVTDGASRCGYDECTTDAYDTNGCAVGYSSDGQGSGGGGMS